MKSKELLKLPLGKYIITDGIYTHELEKYVWNDPVYNKDREITYRIKEKGSGPFAPSISIHYEDLEEVYENYRKYQHKGFTSHIHIFGLSVKGPCRFLSELRFVPRGSFKSFIENCEELEVYNLEPVAS